MDGKYRNSLRKAVVNCYGEQHATNVFINSVKAANLRTNGKTVQPIDVGFSNVALFLLLQVNRHTAIIVALLLRKSAINVSGFRVQAGAALQENVQNAFPPPRFRLRAQSIVKFIELLFKSRRAFRWEAHTSCLSLPNVYSSSKK